MAAIVLSCSPAVQIALRMAADLAQSSSRLVEPAHLLCAIFSLEKLSGTIVPMDTRTEVVQEVDLLAQACQLESVSVQTVRRKIRKVEAFPVATSRNSQPQMSVNKADGLSEVVRKALEDAARSRNSSQVRLIRLTRSLLVREPRASVFVGLDSVGLERFVSSLAQFAEKEDDPAGLLEVVAGKDVSIFDSLNAQEIVDDHVDWAMIGPAFAEICELSWTSGVSSKLENLYEAALKVIVGSIAAAETTAIMLTDASGKFLLKSHLPKGVLSASTSSATKAMAVRRGFIWQRGDDLSGSQLENNTQSGIYAPILSSSETFGVICVDANAAASRFTRNDLFLVTSLGHQLGLTIANRKLEDQLRHSAKLVERLLTNFSPKVRERLLRKAEAGRLKLGGEKSVISIVCCDIRGFTRMTSGMDTEDIVSLLNEYFSILVAVVFRHGGSVDKFIGDAMLAVFGSPEPDRVHAENSLKAALEMQFEVEKLSARRDVFGLPSCGIGIGAHTGEVIHGFIGSPERMEFTVIGSAVNLASRYCDAAKGGEVILSGEMLEEVWKQAVVEAVDIQTKHEGTLTAYRLKEMRPRA